MAAYTFPEGTPLRDQVRAVIDSSTTPLRNVDVATALGRDQGATHKYFKEYMAELVNQPHTGRRTAPPPMEVAVPTAPPVDGAPPPAVSGQFSAHWYLVMEVGGRRFRLTPLDE